MKLSSVVNFANVLRTVFMLADPKSVKKIDNMTARVKASGKTLMKLSYQ